MKPTYKGTLHNIVLAPTEGTVAPLAERANRPSLTEHGVARRDLERYYWIISQLYSRYSTSITDTVEIEVKGKELKMLERMIREGKTATADDLRLLWAEVAESGDAELAVRLRDMEPCELVKLVDYVERGLIEKE